MNDMSGGGSATSYSTLRRGLKATTSKLMGSTSVKRPTGIPPAPFERGSLSERGDPGRFQEGVTFKGKLIGVLEVSEARGDRMCQEALAELKIAVRAAGEHKQRITISVAMDGIRLTDERTGDCLYHHPVHKISFIAQDMTDTRAFGYIFGSPDAGHKFFGIKTEKTASQVVIAMRDLFQVVFERKKKEIEKARAQLEEGRDGSDFKESGYGALFGANGEPGIVSASLTSGAGGAIADLLDLQSELSSLQRGLSEISKRTQCVQKQQSQSKDEHFDPFGDSFKPGLASVSDTASSKSSRISSSSVPTPAPLAPPPISGRSRHDSQKMQQQQQQTKVSDFAKFPVDFKNFSTPPVSQIAGDRYAVFKEEFASDVHRRSIGSTVSVDSGSGRRDEFEGQWNLNDRPGEMSELNQNQTYDIFTELDPLGTGKVKPFVDKKDFFNDVRKQTSRRLLRGMGDGEESLPCGSHKVPPGVIPPEVSALVASSSLYNTPTNPSTISSLKQPVTSTHTTPVHGSVLPTFVDCFADSFVGQPGNREHQEGSSSSFADFNRFADSPRSQRSEFSSGSAIDEPATSLSVGSLTVALPPESFRDSPPPFSPPPPPHTPARSLSGSSSPQHNLSNHSPAPRHRLTKQNTLATPASPKTLPRSHKFPRQGSYEIGWDSGSYFSSRISTTEDGISPIISSRGEGGISPRPRPRSSLSKQFSSGSSTLPLRGSFGRNMIRGTISPSDLECGPFPSEDMNLSYEEAPEPPPRPAHVEPPPLPPKRLPSHITLRPPPRPPPSSESHYNYINDYDSSPDDSNVRSPPIPIPARKPRYQEAPSSSFNITRVNAGKSATETFQFPKTSHSPTRELCSSTGAVPKSGSRGSTPSKSSTPGKSPRIAQRGLTPESIDLTNTSLDQLAAKLNMPIEQLAKMTVVELAACLAQMQLRSDSQTDEPMRSKSEDGYEIPRSQSLPFDEGQEKRSWPTSEKFCFEDDDMFARFDAQFPKSPVDAPSFPPTENESKFPLGAPVSEDRYAVFRELTASAKQKSVFDENLLTPQNSMEEEVSEVSSGTFKANFAEDLHQDSVEQKSSISDEGDATAEATELGSRSSKEWESCERIDHECVTVFRSPDISEYENFEPNFEPSFECKFDDDFSITTLSERSETPINSPAVIAEPSPRLKSVHKSPFTDDFSKVTNATIYSEAKFNKTSNDDKFVSNFNDYNSLGNGRSSAFSESSTTRSLSEKSPFEDDFSDFHIKQKTIDTSSLDDNVFDADDKRSKRLERSSKRKSKKSSSLDAPNGSSVEKSPRSPFDDDFSRRTSKYEVLRDLDAERSSPFDDHEDRKSIGSLHSIQEETRQGFDNRSPYNEVQTPPSYVLRNRGPSRISLGSEGSADIRQSPFEDNFNPTFEDGSKINTQSLRSDEEEKLPKDSAETEVEEEVEAKTEEKIHNGDAPQTDFADFENAFSEGKVSFDDISEERKNDEAEEFPEEEQTVTIGEEKSRADDQEEPAEKNISKEINSPDEDVFPESEPEFRVSARFPKVEVENIFRRDSDPFSDDFFDEDPTSFSEPLENSASSVPTTKDIFWQEPFDSFTFQNG